MGHMHQQGPWLYQEHWPTHGPLWLHRPQTSAGLRWLHLPLTSAWLPEAAKPEYITKAWGSAQAACVHMNLRLQSNLDHRQQHDLLWCLVPWWSFEEVQSRKWTFPSSQAYIFAQIQGHLEAGLVGLSLYIILLTPAGQWQHVDLSPSLICHRHHVSSSFCLPSAFLLCFGFSFSGQGFLDTLIFLFLKWVFDS